MVFGRKIPLRRSFSAGLSLLKILPRLIVVKRPLAILWSYLRQQSPDFIDLRSGHRIFLSSHPHDIVTFVVVFLRRDYGKVEAGEVVIDVGANIGSFSVFAALSGAKKVYAFEPSLEAFEILSKNVMTNGLEGIIVPVNKAVTDRSGEVVKFPRKSSPYNSLAMTGGAADELEEVSTVSLEAFMEEEGIAFINLLKLDCEGAEFSIVPALTKRTIDRIRRIRLECHDDPTVLMNSFRSDAFAVEHSRAKDLWLVNRSEPQHHSGR